MRYLTLEELEKKYIVGKVEQFDQKNDMYRRSRWQPEVRGLWAKLWEESPPQNKPGYTLKDRALENALWYIENGFAVGNSKEGYGLYSWESGPTDKYHVLPSDLKEKVTDPAEMSRIVKKVARLAGADLVGICQLDRRWLYSHIYDCRTREYKVLEVPPEINYAIAFAVEMDHDLIKTSPTCIGGAGAGLGYSKHAYTAGILAEFIRNLGYKAIPAGNTTGLSVPIAISAGLGELGRHGMLITYEFGPRVRLAKVLTGLPLQPDTPVEFGVTQFCEKCKKCAQHCPAQAIHYGERTDKPLNISNNPGVLKWPIDAEKCLRFWVRNGSTCGNCIRVCPFNKEPGWLHDMVKWGVSDLPWLDSFFVWTDGLFGYDKQLRPEEYWAKMKS
jgi:reductive dehalogenase